MTKIKICGLRREEDIAYVNESKPDYIGFVFAKSKRQVTKEQALALRAKLSKEIIPVGVFVNEAKEVVADLVNSGAVDIAQLHGDEDACYINELRKLIPQAKIIKAVRVASRQDVIDSADIPADYLLFDSFSLQEYGGTGHTFDWQLISNINKPFFLAGGINETNVEQAIAQAHPYAVDLSSAVETDGYKDHDKIAKIVGIVKNGRN